MLTTLLIYFDDDNDSDRDDICNKGVWRNKIIAARHKLPHLSKPHKFMWRMRIMYKIIDQIINEIFDKKSYQIFSNHKALVVCS